MASRAYEPMEAQIVFTKDFQDSVMGDLLPGQQTVINYDSDRLPEERSTYNGLPAWSITAYAMFAPTDTPKPFLLSSRPGTGLSKRATNSAGGPMLQTSIPIPDSPQELILYFVNTGRSGMVYYDSDYGRNYTFRFVSRDVRVVSSVITSDPQTPYSGFGVEVSADPSITQVGVNYHALNMPNNPFEGSVQLSQASSPDNRIPWSVYGVAVPYRATINFEVAYVVNGQTYVDDNHGKGYIAAPSN